MAMLCQQSAFASARLFARRIFSNPLRRWLGTAAAVEAVFDRQWDEDERFSNRSPPMQPQEVADTWWQMNERSHQWVFMGSPSSQKRDCATRAAQLLHVPYISMGTLVRQELNPHSSLYSKEHLDQIADIDLVVNSKSSKDSFVKKHIGNDVCACCGKIFDIFNSQSTRVNLCLGSTNHSKLNDSGAFDMDKSCPEKLQMYSEQQSKQLEDYYRQQKKSLDFHASGRPVETLRCQLAAFHLQQTHAARLSQKLKGCCSSREAWFFVFLFSFLLTIFLFFLLYWLIAIL